MHRTPFLLLAGVCLALLGDCLLRPPFGLNFPIWVASFLLLTACTTAISPIHSGLALPSLFFAGCVAWRESTFLTVSNTVVVIGLAVLPHMQHAGIVLRNAFLVDYVSGLRIILQQTWTGAVEFFTVELPAGSDESAWQRHAMPLAIGIGLAIPVMATFAVLFSSADPTFRRMAQHVVNVSPSVAIDHLVLSGIIGVACIGYLRGLLLPPSPPGHAVNRTTQGRLGLVEIAVPLGGLILLCTAFVVLQVPYLFGNAAHVESTSQLSYASYARRGFFELTTAAALVVPILLGADRLLRHTTRTTGAFRLLALVQIALVAILMVSAMHRMGLYWKQYGLTTTRLYATAIMVWIGSVLVWFALTVLRGQRHRFAFGSIVSGLLTLAALNFANPDGLIARVNLIRDTPENRLDSSYLASLSTDAYPSILANVQRLPPGERCRMLATIRQGIQDAGRDWRAWTLSLHRATRTLRRYDATLPSACDVN